MTHAKLRGRIKEYFNTQSAFAEAMEMSEPTLRKKLCCEVEWKMAEVKRACELLHIQLDEIHIYF